MCRVTQVDLVDYSRLTDFGMQITKYVNRNLKDIIRVLIDVLETDPEFELNGFSQEITWKCRRNAKMLCMSYMN